MRPLGTINQLTEIPKLNWPWTDVLNSYSEIRPAIDHAIYEIYRSKAMCQLCRIHIFEHLEKIAGSIGIAGWITINNNRWYAFGDIKKLQTQFQKSPAFRNIKIQIKKKQKWPTALICHLSLSLSIYIYIYKYIYYIYVICYKSCLRVHSVWGG